MMKGTIRIIKAKEEYGFIEPDTGHENVFFRFSWLKVDRVQEGQRVEFDIERGDKGLRARNLKIIPSAASSSFEAETDDSSEYRFLNPYNFVRNIEKPRPECEILGNCSPPPHDRYAGLSGKAICKAKAVTPLFISDSHAITENDNHKIYRFFQYDGEPMLPSSSLRGLIRALFEALTNSCYVAFDESILSKHFESRRSPWLVPARLEYTDEKWRLRLLTGTTDLQIESKDKKSPVGLQYAAWCASYWPFKPSKTLLGINSASRKGYRLNAKQINIQESFINRTKNREDINPDKVVHGEECYALLQQFQHPHPRIKFWNAVEVRRKKEDLSNPRNSNERIEQGWLCITNQNIESKHSERFFFRDPNNKIGPDIIDLPSDTKILERYESLIQDYQKRHKNTVKKHLEKGYPSDEPVLSRFVYGQNERTIRGKELVYVMLEGTPSAPQAKFIVPVSVPRVSYEHGVGELLPEHLHHCNNYQNLDLCPACRVFGWVHKRPPKDAKFVAYAGRVRISNGELIRSEESLRDIPLAILSAPKPTTTSFYLLNKRGEPDPTVDYDTDGARLRGRKFYRHHDSAGPEEYTGKEPTEQNRTVHGALDAGATFKFTVEFENLAPLELGALLYALELEEGMFHRLGYAKPLGFGSIKITVDSLKTIDDWSKRLSSLDSEAGWSLADKIALKKDFLKEMRSMYHEEFDNVLVDLKMLLSAPSDLPIHYPLPPQTLENDRPQFEWFMGNKRRGKEGFALDLARDDTKGFPLIDKNGNIK